MTRISPAFSLLLSLLLSDLCVWLPLKQQVGLRNMALLFVTWTRIPLFSLLIFLYICLTRVAAGVTSSSFSLICCSTQVKITMEDPSTIRGKGGGGWRKEKPFFLSQIDCLWSWQWSQRQLRFSRLCIHDLYSLLIFYCMSLGMKQMPSFFSSIFSSS